MDGNRRFGRARFGSVGLGHEHGGQTLQNFVDWSIAAGVKTLTVYAFSTENWSRSPSEIATIIRIFWKYTTKMLTDALEKNIRVNVLATDPDSVPSHLLSHFRKLEAATAHCDGFVLNLCVSYGSRGEIVNACKSIATDVQSGAIGVQDVTEAELSKRMLTGASEPDLMIRTSGEVRLSNFLLWQLAYAEMVFVDKCWPELEKHDFDDILLEFARRKRRFGK